MSFRSLISFGKSRSRRLVRRSQLEVQALEARALPCTTSAGATLFPAPALGSQIATTPHVWTADAKGLYHTTTDLKAEWQALYQRALAGDATLTPIQHLEANAEAIFENTGLNQLGAKKQARDREDVQREFDAIAAAMKLDQTNFQIDPTAPLTEGTYLRLEATLQGDSTLWELALQGHGLNHPPASRYRGYTNDFQNNVDNSTLFVGGGLDNNEAAIPTLLDDAILSHVPFPVVWQNGQLEQLNQNADAEDTLVNAVVGLDDYMFGRVLTSSDFSQTPSSANDGYVSPFQQLVSATQIDLTAGPSNGFIQGLLGPVSTTVTITPHVWTADANGLFHTSNLAAEWQGYYQKMVSGHAGDLTAIQRLEGNAEAVFESTGIAALSPDVQQQYREDAQREFDAIAVAMQIDQAKYGIDPSTPLTPTTYWRLERTIQSDATLLELSWQGHGLNNPPSSRYNGYTNDFQNGVDGSTRYIGGGLNNGKNALTDFFDDNVITHLPFPLVYRNGKLVQLNQNGDAENSVTQAVRAANASLYYRVYLSYDFRGSRHGHSGAVG